MRKLLGVALTFGLVGWALPAHAAVATSTDLAVKVTVTDITTLSTTETHPGDRVKFRVRVANLGPDEAANLTVTADPQNAWRASCVYSSGGHGTCTLTNVLAGFKGKAMVVLMDTPASGEATGTFCVSIVNSPEQTDPDAANNCATGSLPVV